MSAPDVVLVAVSVMAIVHWDAGTVATPHRVVAVVDILVMVPATAMRRTVEVTAAMDMAATVVVTRDLTVLAVGFDVPAVTDVRASAASCRQATPEPLAPAVCLLPPAAEPLLS